MPSQFKEYLPVAHYQFHCMQHILSQFSAVLGNFCTISLSLFLSLSSSSSCATSFAVHFLCRVLVTDKQSDVYFLKFELVAMNPMRGIHTISVSACMCVCMSVCACIAYLELTEFSRHRNATTFDWKILFSIWFSPASLRHKSFRRKAKTFIVKSSGISIKKARRHHRPEAKPGNVLPSGEAGLRLQRRRQRRRRWRLRIQMLMKNPKEKFKKKLRRKRNQE